MDAKSELQDDSELVEFVEKWALDAESQDVLVNLPQAVQMKVMAEFAPRDTSKDCNAIFMKFARGISLGVPQKTSNQAHHEADEAKEIESFLESWALGNDAKAVFLALDGEQRQRVMAEFAPRDTSRDCNVLFIKFAQGIANKTPRMTTSTPGLGACGRGAATPRGPASFGQSPTITPKAVRRETEQSGSRRTQLTSAEVAQLSGGQVTVEMLETFVATWGLDSESKSLLCSLSPSVFVKVLTDFNPRDTSRDANNIFRSFASSLSTRMGGTQQQALRPQHQPVLIPAVTPVARQAVTPQPAVNHTAPSPVEMMAFVRKWVLGSEAQAVLFSLRPDAASRVMREFQPRDTSSDANNIFMKFAQGVSRNMAAAEANHAARILGFGAQQARFTPY